MPRSKHPENVSPHTGLRVPVCKGTYMQEGGGLMLQGHTTAIVPCGNPTPKKLPTGGGEWPTFRTAHGTPPKAIVKNLPNYWCSSVWLCNTTAWHSILLAVQNPVNKMPRMPAAQTMLSVVWRVDCAAAKIRFLFVRHKKVRTGSTVGIC